MVLCRLLNDLSGILVRKMSCFEYSRKFIILIRPNFCEKINNDSFNFRLKTNEDIVDFFKYHVTY